MSNEILQLLVNKSHTAWHLRGQYFIYTYIYYITSKVVVKKAFLNISKQILSEFSIIRLRIQIFTLKAF